MICHLTGCGKPSSPLFSHICGEAYQRHDFCSEGHQLQSLWLENSGQRTLQEYQGEQEREKRRQRAIEELRFITERNSQGDMLCTSEQR